MKPPTSVRIAVPVVSLIVLSSGVWAAMGTVGRKPEPGVPAKADVPAKTEDPAAGKAEGKASSDPVKAAAPAVPAGSSAPKEAPPPQQEPSQRHAMLKSFCGTVLFVSGSQVVANVAGGAQPQERFTVYREGARRLGEMVAAKSLDKETVVLSPVGSVSAAVGDRLERLE